MSEKLQRFTDLMKQVFELDKSDLDFGIYRIMNIRKAEIEKFLTEGLPQKVRDTLAPFAQGDKDEIKAKMAQIEQALGDVSAIPDTVPMKAEYLKLQKQLAEGTDLAALETDVYSALYSFFNRYYEEGDFISKRRYKEGVYAIPYEGEEVKLYWANQDQYYIKTSENFKDYTFVVDEYTVHFRLVDATTEQNNNKESADSKRVFMLFTEDEENYPGIKTFEYNDETKELIIRFIFDIPEDKKKKYFDENYEAIRKFVFENHLPMWSDLLSPIPGNDTIDLLKKHLNGYVAKNTFDYFIHKDLRGFLTRELDFYIKSEIMHLDDLDTGNEARVETYLAKVKAIKRVGKIIIDFLAQIEDFQKKLWLKKKFVVETNWCMTLDKVDESFWPEIIESKAQIDEWIAMYAIDEVEPAIGVEGWTDPPSLDFLRQNQNLLIDTRHFNEDFKERLVASIDRLDEQTNGILVFSENYQAINLLQAKFVNKIQQIYIDPPFNLEHNGDYLYKTDYKDSSWLSLLENRIIIARKLLRKQGLFTLRCDINGNSLVRQLCNSVFGENLFEAELLVQRIRKNVTGQGKITLPLANDSLFVYMNSEESSYANPYKTLKATREDYWRRIDDSAGYRNPPQRIIFGKEFMPYKHDAHFKFSQETIQAMIQERRIRLICKECKYEHYEGEYYACPVCGSQNCTPQYKVLASNEMVLDTNWLDLPGYSSNWGFSTENALPLLKRTINLGCDKNAIIMDFFGGSGTTGHATIELNREDKGNRKYILVDMGEQFNDVLLPRIKKVTYSPKWKNGVIQARDSKSLHQIIKYMRLESYEDALSNIELTDDTHSMQLLFGEEYLIQYMLDLESKDSLLNVAAFKDPFSYQMRITEKNECKERPVDLIETFNYLIGLTVTHQGAVLYFSAKPAADPTYEGAVELTKDLGGQYAFRQIEGSLPDGRRALVIWRTVSDNVLESNAALDAYFTKYRINPADREYDVIFVNGDNNLENLRTTNETWKVQMTETEFKKRMFEE